MSNELKPCPFCGGEVNIGLQVGLESGKSCFYIYCENCDLGFSKGDAERDELATEWNTRAETEAKSHWRKYPEEKPLIDDEYIVLLESGKAVTTAFYFVLNDNFAKLSDMSTTFITHWQPLPEPPEEE